MSQTVSSQRVAARPIRALIIKPDNTHEVREIQQDIRTLEGLVGGYLEAVFTPHCVFWFNTRRDKGLARNDMATYLWWKTNPAMEGQDMFQGPVFVTGLTNDDSDSLPVPDEVVELFERMEQIRREEEGK
jgi:hypothetical protein